MILRWFGAAGVVTALCVNPVQATEPISMEAVVGPFGARLVAFTVDVADAPAVLAGFDVQRRTLMECGSEVRLNAEMLARPESGQARFTLVDATAVPDLFYEYRVFFVDAQRQPLDPCTLYDCTSYQYYYISCTDRVLASSGPSVYAHTTLSHGGGLLLPGIPCPGSCGIHVVIESWPPELDAYADTGQPVRLIGYLSYVYGGVEGCWMAYVTSFEVQDCAVSSAETSWGAVKSTYR